MSKLEQAVLGGGCFWCLEAFFQRLPGVTKVEPGYAGGDDPSPTYKAVCEGDTGHAEVIRVTFDPARLGYATLLELFWICHDPTTPNRQGNDVGPQYRSIILWSGEAQRAVAERSLREAAANFPRPIVTELRELGTFHPAEAYHHDYFNRNPDQAYCALVIAPKVRKLLAAGVIGQP